MTWWMWLILWTVLVLGAGLVFFLLGRDLWRKSKALGRQISEITERFSA